MDSVLGVAMAQVVLDEAQIVALVGQIEDGVMGELLQREGLALCPDKIRAQIAPQHPRNDCPNLGGARRLDRSAGLRQVRRMSAPVLLRGDGGRFLPGNGSTGRPKGARNRLGERFLHDLHQDWQVHGPSVLARVREEEPGTYLRVIAALAAHLTPRAAPEEPPPLSASPGLFFPSAPVPRLDPAIERLCEAIIALEPRSPADLSEEELTALWGPELVRLYRETITAGR
jgi:hypothetical protein